MTVSERLAVVRSMLFAPTGNDEREILQGILTQQREWKKRHNKRGCEENKQRSMIQRRRTFTYAIKGEFFYLLAFATLTGLN